MTSYTKNKLFILHILNIIGRPFFIIILHGLRLISFLSRFTKLHLPKIRLHPPLLHLSILKQLKTHIHFKSLQIPHSKLPNKIVIFTLFFITAISLFTYQEILKDLPNPRELTTRKQKLTTIITDRRGQTLFKIYKDENRTLVKLNSLSPYTVNAFIAIEDKNFFNHQGFSLKGILRALEQNIKANTTYCKSPVSNCRLQGGSTITQQLIKNTLLSSEQTWQRKTKELILAIHTELIFSKNAILEMYLNELGFGGPSYGIQAASQQYFATNATDLSIAQAAFLAGLPKAPSKFSPYINPEIALARQKLVLYEMWQQNYITQDQFHQASLEKLKFSSPKIEIKAPHFVMFVRDLLVDQLGESLVTQGGLRVTTTLDLDIQAMAQKEVKKEIQRLKKLNVSNGAVLITKPKTGEILTMVGSTNYFDIEHDGQVNLTTSSRQPGSSIKPINYSLAFEKKATPATFITDQPVTFKTKGQVPWSPKNYDNKFHGRVTLRTALANSYNIPAVLLLAQNGIENMAELSSQMGITTFNNPQRFGLSMTLGSLEVKMTDMAQVYSSFANSGKSIPLQSILEVRDSNGKKIDINPCYPKQCQPIQAISKETAFLITDILSDNVARSPAFGWHSTLNIKNHKVAVKTGTSNNLRDNWTIGYTPDFLVGVWVGNNNNTPMNRIASGLTGASSIWNKLFSTILSNNEPNNTTFTKPDTLVQVPICIYTGTLKCSSCPTKLEYFVKGTEPNSACSNEYIQKILTQKQEQAQTKN